MYTIFIKMKWVTPSEFWNLAPCELWWVIDAMTAKDKMSQETASELYDMLMAAKAEEALAAKTEGEA